MSQLVGPVSALVLIGGLALLARALALGLWSMASGRGTRRVGFAVSALAAFTLGGFATVAGGTLSLKCHEIEFALDEPHLVETTRRAEPLIRAIDAFTTRNGAAPEGLDQLVPAYINAIPGTGWSLHPRFEYEKFDEGPWKLFVRTTKLGAFDEFVYDPRFTQLAESGYIDRVGDWYYLHE
jgi:hypothetical protein